jgi:brefeldin A-resistance guanine nucleotide exchange factor 1
MAQDGQSHATMDAALTEARGNSDVPPCPSTSALPVLSAVGRASDTQYRSRPVSVAVDPVSLVISECISVTSVMRKHARWAGSSVSSILGGNPNPIQLGPPSPLLRPGSKGSVTTSSVDGAQDMVVANRWGLRGKKGKSMQDNPLMVGFGRLRHDLSSCKGIAVSLV